MSIVKRTNINRSGVPPLPIQLEPVLRNKQLDTPFRNLAPNVTVMRLELKSHQLLI